MKPILICALLAASAGCSTTPAYDARFGDAVRSARMAMLVHPGGAPAPAAAAGADGQAAREAYARYLNTFKEPPPIVNVINIGGAVGGGNAR